MEHNRNQERVFITDDKNAANEKRAEGFVTISSSEDFRLYLDEMNTYEISEITYGEGANIQYMQVYIDWLIKNHYDSQIINLFFEPKNNNKHASYLLLQNWLKTGNY